MSENRLNAYLKAKGIEPKGDDTDYVIGTGFTQASASWAEENSELAQWMIPGGAAVMMQMNNSDNATGAVTGSDVPVTGSDATTGAVTGSDVPVTGSDDTTGAVTGSDVPVTGGDPSEVEPVVDENVASTPEDIANAEHPEEVTVDATSEDAVNAINNDIYYNNININGEA